MRAEASKLIHRLRFVGTRPVGHGGVTGAMPGNFDRAGGAEAPSVRVGICSPPIMNGFGELDLRSRWATRWDRAQGSIYS